jgi:hypothetical protein
MPSRIGTWMIAVGALVMFIGICCLPGAFGTNPDLDLRMAGITLFSMGAVLISAGMYIKARSLPSAGETGNSKKDPAAPGRRTRGGCELCGSEAPVVQCKVHQLQLCGACLGNHYDSRSCVYVPSARNVAHPGKAMAAKARG